MTLNIAALFNKDSKAKKEELEGFDFTKYASIEPVIAMAKQLQERILSA